MKYITLIFLLLVLVMAVPGQEAEQPPAPEGQEAAPEEAQEPAASEDQTTPEEAEQPEVKDYQDVADEPQIRPAEEPATPEETESDAEADTPEAEDTQEEAEAPEAGAEEKTAAPPADIKPLMKTVRTNFKKGNYEAADKAVDMALALKGDDYEAVKYKGMISMKLGNMEAANEYLKLANTAGGKDAELLLYTGAYFEKVGKYMTAEKAFLRHGEFGPHNPFAREMKKLAEYIRPKAAKERAKNALESESALDISNVEPNTIAVVSFTNKGEEKELDPLQKGLAEMIATDLSQVKRLTVIERVQMQALVDEMALDMTGLLEEKNSERIGKLLRAEKVINGSFAEADGIIKMDAGIADAIEEESKPVEGVEGNLEDLFKVEKYLVFKIVKEMDIVLTEDERKQIEVIPTENILAFLAYSKGLDAEDRGDFAAAQEFYGQAVKADPNFRQATQAQQKATSNNKISKSSDLTAVASTSTGVGKAITTPVFTVGALNFSARGSISLYTINSVNSSFMPEKQIASVETQTALKKAIGVTGSGNIERNSYIDAYNIGFGGGGKSVEVKVPIPDDGN